MKISNLFLYSARIYRILIITASAVVLTYFFPKTYKLDYNFQAGQIWKHARVYAPFAFTAEVTREEQGRALDFKRIRIDKLRIKNEVEKKIAGTFELPGDSLQNLILDTRKTIDVIYRKGFIKDTVHAESSKFFTPSSITAMTNRLAKNYGVDSLKLQGILNNYLLPNVLSYQKKPVFIKEKININPNQILIERNQKITPEKYQILKALQQKLALKSHYKFFVLGSFFLIALLFLTLLTYLYGEFHRGLYINNRELSVLILNLTLIVVIIFLMQKYLPQYIYATPFIILPVVINTFFDKQMAIITTVIALILATLGLYTPFEFMFIQIAAVFASILFIKDITNRSRLFISILYVIFVYILAYLLYSMLTHGGMASVDWSVLLQFIVSGILSIAFIHELVLLIEKLYGLASDVSLLELQNTNNPLLREMAEKAPGTFQHSMQVANLAESIANEIGANAMLVRVGALYHDIGKMKNPKYFTENQLSGINPHDQLKPEESARIIISHVLDGIEMARKNNIPERIINFIRTHHGTGLVYYFYRKAKDQNPDTDEKQFRYPGPNPFSKETAILMMADSVEAASKSLKNPDVKTIEELVDNIIDRQVREGLLDNANITLKEINKAKKILKNKLKSIYHLRVEYPE